VLGHIKGVLILAAGYLFLDRPAAPRNLVAVAVAVVAMVSYAAVRGGESPTAPAPAAGAPVLAAYAALLLGAAVWLALPA
jgi:hypothetical protein